jgi:hypothetical protein
MNHVVVQTLVAAGVVAVVTWVVMDLWMQCSRRKKKAPIKWPLLGSLVEVLCNYHRYNDWLVPYLQKASTMRVDLPAGPTYTYTVDPSNVEHILKNNFANYPKVDFNALVMH